MQLWHQGAKLAQQQTQIWTFCRGVKKDWGWWLCVWVIALDASGCLWQPEAFRTITLWKNVFFLTNESHSSVIFSATAWILHCLIDLSFWKEWKIEYDGLARIWKRPGDGHKRLRCWSRSTCSRFWDQVAFVNSTKVDLVTEKWKPENLSIVLWVKCWGKVLRFSTAVHL